MRLAASVALCLLLAAPAAAAPAVTGATSPQEPYAVHATMEQLDLWLDTYTDLPRPDTPLARIGFVAAGEAVPYAGRMTRLESTMRGLYDEASATIYLVRPWFGDTAPDRSVLLHEMAHHRQATAKHWYCPEAMEWDAYRIQEEYLAKLGETGDFNWTWIALLSSCAPRDHHPD